MQRWQAVLITIAATLGTAYAFPPLTLAPGADQVRVTTKPGDVATCKPVGNVRVTGEDALDSENAHRQFLNEVVGLGGNTALVTSPDYPNYHRGLPMLGIAYICP